MTTPKPFTVRRCLSYFISSDRRVPDDRASHLAYLLFFLCFVGAPFLIEIEPANATPLSLFGWPLPGACPSQQYLKVECPGCGLTRAFVALAHGAFGLSWHYHRLGIGLYLFFLMRIPVHAWLLVKRGDASRPMLERLYNGTAWAMIALLLVNWVIGLFTGSNGGW